MELEQHRNSSKNRSFSIEKKQNVFECERTSEEKSYLACNIDSSGMLKMTNPEINIKIIEPFGVFFLYYSRIPSIKARFFQ